MKKLKLAIFGAAAGLLMIGGMSSFENSESSSKYLYWKKKACPAGMSGYICVATNQTLPLCYDNLADNYVGGKYKYGFYNCTTKVKPN